MYIYIFFCVESGNGWKSHTGVESHDSVHQRPPHFTASPRIVRVKIRNIKGGYFSVVCVRHGLVSSPIFLFFRWVDPFGVNSKEGQFLDDPLAGTRIAAPRFLLPWCINRVGDLIMVENFFFDLL